jgi:hypothetical protein
LIKKRPRQRGARDTQEQESRRDSQHEPGFGWHRWVLPWIGSENVFRTSFYLDFIAIEVARLAELNLSVNVLYD